MMDASSRLLRTCEETRELIAEALKARLPLKRQAEEFNQTLETTQSLKRTRPNAADETDYSVSRDISTATVIPDIVLDREAFHNRLESFTDAFITHKRPITAVQCAMHGFIDTHILEGPKHDICKLECEVCQSTSYVIDLTNLNLTNCRLKSIVDKYTSGLLVFHKDDCVWKKHQCPTQIYSFQRISHREAIEKVRTEGKELLQYGAHLPLIEHPLNPEQLKKLEHFIRDVENPAGRYEFSCTPLSPLSEDVWTSYTLPLFGWQLIDNGALKCASCFRQHRPDQFDGADHVRFNIIKEHRDYCPWINSSSAQIAPPRPSPFIKSVCGYEWMVATIELEYEILLKLRDESPVYQSSRTQWFNAEQQRVRRARKMLYQEFPDTSRMALGGDTSQFDLTPSIPQGSAQAETPTVSPMEQREEQLRDASLAIPSTKEDEKKAEVSTAVHGDTERDVGDGMVTDDTREVPQLPALVINDESAAAPDQGNGTEVQDHHDEQSDSNELPFSTSPDEVSKAKTDATNVKANTSQAISSPPLYEAHTLPITLTVANSPLPKHLKGELRELLDSEPEPEDTERKESQAPKTAEETVEATEDDLGEEFYESILNEVEKMEGISTPADEEHAEHNDELDLEAAEVSGEYNEAMEVEEEEEPQKSMAPDKTSAIGLDDLDDEMEELSQSPAVSGEKDEEELLIEEVLAENNKVVVDASKKELSNTTELDNADTQAPVLANDQLLETEESEIEAFAQSPAPGTERKDEEPQVTVLDDTQIPQNEGEELGRDVQSQSIVIEVETPLNNTGTPNFEASLDDVDQPVAVEVKEVEAQGMTLDIVEDSEKKEEEDRVEATSSSVTAGVNEVVDEEMALVDQNNAEVQEPQETIQIVEISTEDTNTEMAKDAIILTASSDESIHDVNSPMADATAKEGDTAMDETKSELDVGEHVLSIPIPEVQAHEDIDDIGEKDKELKDALSVTNTADGEHLDGGNEEEKQDTTEQTEDDNSAENAPDMEEDIDQEGSNLDHGRKTQSSTGASDDVVYENEGSHDTSSNHEEYLDEDEHMSPSADGEKDDKMTEAHESLDGQEGEELGEIAQHLTPREGMDEEKQLDDVLDGSKAEEESPLEDAADTLLRPDDNAAAEDSSSDNENLKTCNQDTQNPSGDNYESREQVTSTDETMAKDLQEDV